MEDSTNNHIRIYILVLYFITTLEPRTLLYRKLQKSSIN